MIESRAALTTTTTVDGTETTTGIEIVTGIGIVIESGTGIATGTGTGIETGRGSGTGGTDTGTRGNTARRRERTAEILDTKVTRRVIENEIE